MNQLNQKKPSQELPLIRNTNMKFIELFAGIGGFRYGLEMCGQSLEGSIRNGIRQRGDLPNTLCEGNRENRDERTNYSCVWANEIDKYACQIYRRNYGEGELYEGDITKVKSEEIPDHDLLVGGFPCQAFSIAGKRGGFQDTRGTLFFEIARIAQEKRPRLLLLENVKGLLSHDKGRTFGTILTMLDEIGYDCQWQVLNSKNFGVPQNRERVFIIGHLRGTSRPEVFPIGEEPKNYIKPDASIPMQATNTLRSNYSNGHANETYTTQGTRIRRLTPTECERLQGFPDGWTEGVSDTQRYKCLGNAVTTNVITEIGKKLCP